MALLRKAILNWAAALLEFIARITVNVLITPILLQGLGVSLFGVWKVIERMATYMQAVDGRPSQGLQWLIAYHQKSDDLQYKKNAINNAFGVLLIFIPILTIAGIAIILISPYVVKIETEIFTTVRIAAALLAINFIIFSIGDIALGVLNGMNMGYLRMGVVAGITFITGLMMVGGIKAGYGLTGLAGAQLIGGLITTLAYFIIVKKHIPWFRIDSFNFKGAIQFFRFNIWYSIWTFVNKLIMHSDLILLAYLLSTKAAAVYSLTAYAAQILVAFVAMAIGSTIPGIGGIVGGRDLMKAIEIRRELNAYTWLFVLVAGTVLMLWNRSFVGIWVGEDNYAGWMVDILIVIFSVQLIFIRNDAFIIDITLDVKRKVYIGMISAIISIILSIILVPSYGITGLCISLIIGRSPMMIIYPIILHKYFGERVLRSRELMRSIILMSVFYSGSLFLSQLISINTWHELVLYTLLSVIIIFCLAFYTIMTHEQRKYFKQRLQSIYLSNL